MESIPLLGTGAVRRRTDLLLPVILSILVAKSTFFLFANDNQLRAVDLLSLGRKQLHLHRALVKHRVQILAAPPAPKVDENALRSGMGRGWVYRSDAAMANGSVPGVPLTASSAATPEDLKNQQFEKIIKQRQFTDFVVDARTGQPLEYTDEQKRLMRIRRLEDEAKEQADVDALTDPLSDEFVPSKYIYPDGESVIPKTLNIHVHGLSDKHVSADGKVSKHQGPVLGVFREGAFGENSINASEGTFGKFGEGIGFRDRPLAIRDVQYTKIRDKQLNALQAKSDEIEAMRVQIDGQNRTFYCSGKECDDAWGMAGDQVIDLRTGQVIHEGVGPRNGEPPGYQEYWSLDRSIDPHTGQELEHCVGPQCNGFKWMDENSEPWIKDEYGDAPNGTIVFGNTIPPNANVDPEQIRESQREAQAQQAWGGQPEGEAQGEGEGEGEAQGEGEGEGEGESVGASDSVTYEPYALDPRMRAKYEAYQRSQEQQSGMGGWSKNWNAGSWIGFILLGPMLTAGVSTFIFMTRGAMWGSIVLGGLVVFDIVMFYFG